MNFKDEIPVLILHFLESNISENTGIVNEDINLFEVVSGSLDNFISKLD